MADYTRAPGATFPYSRLFGTGFTGQAANLRAQIRAAGPGGAVQAGYPISGFVEDGATGLYSITVTAPSTFGDYLLEITNAAGTTVYASDTLQVTASASAVGTPQPGDLFTIQELKNHLRSIKATDSSKDTQLQQLVTSVSDAAQQYTNHRWAQETGVAKVFRYDDSDGFLDLSPWDLRAVPTLVQVDTDIAAVTLDTSLYRVEPRNAPHGVYTHLDLYLATFQGRSTNFWSDATPGWAGREVTITANWGWPSIPSSLKLAAIECAALIYTNPATAARLSKADSSRDYSVGDTSSLEIPEQILELWAPFRRVAF